MKTVAIYGLGLIGGSFGLALRKAGFPGEILGLSEPPYAETALRMGAITRVAGSFGEIAECADLIYLSHRVDEIIDAISRLGGIAPPHCLITDSGSTKTKVCLAAAKTIQFAEFVGGHPMAGKEQRGIEAADDDLFRDRPYVLTSQSKSAAGKEFEFWLDQMGARVTYLTPETHDRVVAYTSHLPQLLATSLAATLGRENDDLFSQIFGPGLTDMTRLALSAPDLWVSILRSNRLAVSGAFEKLEGTMAEIRKKLDDGDLEEIFAEAARFASALRVSGKSSGIGP